MNGRKARALRRLASRLTTGLPTHQLVSDGAVSKGQPTGRTLPNGKPEVVYVSHPGTLRHKPTTHRAVYQKLKSVYAHVDLRSLK